MLRASYRRYVTSALAQDEALTSDKAIYALSTLMTNRTTDNSNNNNKLM